MGEVPLADRVALLETKVAHLEGLPAQIQRLEVTLRDEIRAGDEETRRQMREGDEETRRQMREGDEETRRLMRVLHEDLLERFKTLGESLGDRNTGRRPRR